MKWLVTGAHGMLGRELAARLLAAEEPDTCLIALGRMALDITDAGAVHAAMALFRPDVVVNCAAYTAVDDAETREGEALRVNGDGPAHLAAACADSHARLIHISTDYVFHSAAGRAPYLEDDPPCPGNAYGRSKLAGELAVLSRLPGAAVIVRTAWLYAAHGHNFVKTIADLARRGETVAVVSDQVGSPTWAADVATRVAGLGRRPEAAGIFHAANTGEATWCEFAREVFRLTGADPDRVHPTSTGSLTAPTPRPAYTALGQRRWREIGMEPLRDWRSALREALPHVQAAGRSDAPVRSRAPAEAADPRPQRRPRAGGLAR